jgi:omega-amidase
MRVGLVQMAAQRIARGDCEHYRNHVRDAANTGCDWVVFPELSDSGYDPGKAFEQGHRQLDTLSHLAREHRIWIFAGMAECAENGRVYNSLSAFAPSGLVAASYRKLHLFRSGDVDETHYFSQGNDPLLLDVDGIKVGFSICFDLRFPSLYRGYAVAGAEVLLNVAAWPLARVADWRLLLSARALENQAYVLGANYCGNKGGLVFGGASMVCGPDGKMVVEENAYREALVVCELDVRHVHDLRKSFPVLVCERDFGAAGVKAG